MPNNQYVNKVVFNGTTLMDVSGTNVAADKLLKGYSAIGPNGELINGSLEQQSVDFSGVNVTADKMLKGTYALDSSGNLIEGSIDVDEILTKLTALQSDVTTILTRDDDSFATFPTRTRAYIKISNPPSGYSYTGIKIKASSKAAVNISYLSDEHSVYIIDGKYTTSSEKVAVGINRDSDNIIYLNTNDSLVITECKTPIRFELLTKQGTDKYVWCYKYASTIPETNTSSTILTNDYSVDVSGVLQYKKIFGNFGQNSNTQSNTLW